MLSFKKIVDDTKSIINLTRFNSLDICLTERFEDHRGYPVNKLIKYRMKCHCHYVVDNVRYAL